MPAQERLQHQRVGTIRPPVVFSDAELVSVPYHFPVAYLWRNWGAIQGKRNADSIDYQRFIWAKTAPGGTSQTTKQHTQHKHNQEVTLKSKTHWGVFVSFPAPH